MPKNKLIISEKKVKFQEISEIVKNVPLHMPAYKGKIISDFIKSGGFQNILELGFAHGTSTCYMAAALDEKNFRLDDDWGWTQKKVLNELKTNNFNNLVDEIYLQQSLKKDLISILRKIRRRINF